MNETINYTMAYTMTAEFSATLRRDGFEIARKVNIFAAITAISTLLEAR